MTEFDLRSECERTLTLTADQHRISHMLTLARTRIGDYLKQQYAETGAVAKFKSRGLGEVRLDGADPEPKAFVTNLGEYSSWVAQRYPEEVITTIEVPAEQLSDALAALGLSGIDVINSKVEVRDVFKTSHLKSVDLVESEESGWTAFDPGTSEQVDGVAGRLPSQILKVLLPKALKETLEEDAEREDADSHPAASNDADDSPEGEGAE